MNGSYWRMGGTRSIRVQHENILQNPKPHFEKKTSNNETYHAAIHADSNSTTQTKLRSPSDDFNPMQFSKH